MVDKDEKTCFVIMPITTPDSYREKYRDDDHFIHVAECLFKPAIEQAGFKPILPISKGSENIHANIIKKIESSDLVLCDMSILNTNVFFEFGIRTALNKPICLVKDEHVQHVPFDTLSINYHTYSSDLSAWIVSKEINQLAEHIKESYQSNEGRNPLWKHFGLSIVAKPDEKVATEDDKFDYINRKLDIVMTRLNEQQVYSDNSRRFGVSSAIERMAGSKYEVGKIRLDSPSYEEKIVSIDRPTYELEKTVGIKLSEMLSKNGYGYSDILIWFTPSASGQNLLSIFIDETEKEKISPQISQEMYTIAKKYGFSFKLRSRKPTNEESLNAYYTAKI